MNHYVNNRNQWKLNCFLNFARKNTSWACLLAPGLKLIFHWKVQLFILLKSSFKFFAVKSLLCITEKSDVPSASSLGFEIKLSDKLFIYINKRSGPRKELWGTPALTLKSLRYVKEDALNFKPVAIRLTCVMSNW